MEKDVIVLNCKKCGEEFLYEYRGSGRKPDYCPSCRKLVSREHVKSYKTSCDEQYEKESFKELEENEFATKIASLLSSLDSLRVSMCELTTEMRNYQSAYDKTDQMYLHKIENADISNPIDAQKLLNEWKKSRNGRRNIKDYILLLSKIIEAIPYKNYTNALPILKGKNYIIR